MNDEIFSTEEALTQHKHSPRLYNALNGFLDESLPVLDFGCGDGYYLNKLSSLGRFPSLVGVEGTKNLSYSKQFDNIIQWDLRNPLWLGIKGNVMSLEVAEHIHEEFLENYLDNLARHCCGKLCISWALRGQGGCRHVSERNEYEVIPLISSYGFHYNSEKSFLLRQEAGIDLWWFRNSIYFFDKK